jgi:uncharacterized repeat protein (TIGR01451 family)
MAFLAPYLLWGAFAAAIPVAIHLFFRSRYRTVPWAAMKFLLTSVEQTSRRLRFQELLLLMMRILLMAIIALALARPILASFREMALLGLFLFVQAFAIARLVTSDRPRLLAKLAEFGVCEVIGVVLLGLFWLVSPTEGALGGRGDAVDAVLVFDTSMSMGARDGGKSRLERGRAEALRLIDQLPPHSTVQIVACAGGSQTLLGPRSAANLDEARELIGKLAPTELGTDLSAGVERAVEIVARGQSPNRELYVFSDMQKLGFEKNATKLRDKITEVKDKASIVMVRCGTQAIRNVAVVGVTPQSGVPRPGDRVSFAVLVRNTGDAPVDNLTVTLTVDGDDKTRDAQSLPQIGPGETKTVALTAKLEKAGLRVLTARVGPDDLDGDNRLDRVIQVRDFVNVLIVDGHFDEREPKKSSSYYLAHALSPARDADRATFYFQPRVVSARLASPALLAKADLCILTDVALEPRPGKAAEVLPADFLAALDPYVRQGHGLVIFAGENVAADAYNRLLSKKYDLLPMRLVKAVKLPASKPLEFDRNSFTRPAFQPFRDDEYYKEFSKVGVWQAFELEESPGSTADAEKKDDRDAPARGVLFRYSNGQPAVVTRSLDAGEVVFVTTAADFQLAFKSDGTPEARTWSMWPAAWMFVPFTHTLINALMHNQSEAYNVTAGETLHWFPSEKSVRSYTLVHPDGKTVRLGQPEKKGKRYEVTADDLPRAGVYHLVAHLPNIGDDSPEALSPGVKDRGVPIAAGPDLAETADLSTFDDAKLDEQLGFTPIHLVADTGATALSVAERLNREWTGWLLVSLLVLLSCEALLAWVCGRAW